MSFQTKEELLAALINDNKFVSYVEVGVWKAENLCFIATHCPLISCYGVDEYKVYRYTKDETSVCSRLEQTEFELIKQIAAQNIKATNKPIVMLYSTSGLAARTFKDKSLDIVFIDAAHDYESVLNDLEVWTPKIRDGGIICGHDYCEYYNGVIKAVNEFFNSPKYKIELLPFKIWSVRS